MGFPGLSASIKNIDPLGRFLSTIRFRTRETSVTCHHSAEPALSPLEFGSTLLFNALDSVQSMLTSRGAVPLYLTWHFDHCNHSGSRAT